MSKKAWFLFLILLGLLGIACYAAYDAGFKTTLINGLTSVGGTVWITLSGAWSDFALLVGSSGTYFLIFTIVMIIVGWQFFGRIFSLVRNKIPLGKKKAVTTPTPVYQDQLSTPQLYTQPPKAQEEKPKDQAKEEAVPA
jgi:hypothetical protein